MGRLPSYYVHELQPGHAAGELFTSTQSTKSDSELCLAIYARTASYSEGLVESLNPYFGSCVELTFDKQVRCHGVDVVIWEPSRHRSEWVAEQELLIHRHPEAQQIALVTYPRSFECEQLMARQVTVLAQPFQITELVRLVHASGVSKVVSDLKKIA